MLLAQMIQLLSSRRGVVLAVLGGWLTGWVWAGPTEPPVDDASLALASVGPSRLTQAGQPLGHQASDEASVAWLRRQALPWAGWYWGWGLSADSYDFQASNGLPLRRLQDMAAQFTLEDYVEGEPAVSVMAHPGLYFGDHPTAGAWDVPVEAISGIPWNATFSGVLGLQEARFYRHLIPVAGIVWIAGENVRLEAVFPEPALVIKLTNGLEARLAGELGGGGFRTGPHQTVEYSTYRVGATLSYQLTPHCNLTGGAGDEIERTFDFLHEPGRVRAGGSPYVEVSIELTR
jgi:hypothetical protein